MDFRRISILTVIAMLALAAASVPTASFAQEAGKTSSVPLILDKSAAGELAFWNSIKDSSSPSDFKTYIANFPNGMFYDPAVQRFEAVGGNRTDLTNIADDQVKAAASPEQAQTKPTVRGAEAKTKPVAAPRAKPAAASKFKTVAKSAAASKAKAKAKAAAAPKVKPAAPKAKSATASKAKPAAVSNVKPAAAPKAKPAAASKAKPVAASQTKSKSVMTVATNQKSKKASIRKNSSKTTCKVSPNSCVDSSKSGGGSSGSGGGSSGGGGGWGG